MLETGQWGDAGARLCQQVQFLIVKVDAVGVPHVAPHPADGLHVGQRAHAHRLQAVVLLVHRLAQVRVQPYAQLPGQHRRLAEEVRGHAEGVSRAPSTTCFIENSEGS